MHIYHYSRRQTLSIGQDVAWAFFANPANLLQLTPAWAGTRDESPERHKSIFPGMLQILKVKMLGPISCYWIAEITHVDAPNSFIDEQKQGPFAFWQHRHELQPKGDGVEVIDTVHYALPCLPFMGLVHEAFIRKRLDALFEYRAQVLEEFFS